MNKVYKVVRSQSTGQSTVTSELAKGKTKSTSNSLARMTALLGSVGMALGATSVFAETCVTLANGTYSCTQSSANENLSYEATGTSGPISLDARTTAGSEGTAEIRLTDSNITGAGAHGVVVRGQGASVILDGTNRFTLSGTDDTAVLAMGNYGAGDNGSITVNGRLDINIDRAGMTNSDGLEAYGVNTDISHHGTGTITTNGGNGILTSAVKNATVKVDGGAVLNISGAGNSGIKISANTGNVEVDSNASITTTGEAGRGIFASTSGNSIGNIDITNTGDITTSGLGAHGILAANAANAAGSGKITINNSGNITTSNADVTSGSGAHSIYASVTNPGANSGGVEINQTGGVLKTTGYDSHGIFALSTALSGDLNVNVSDTIIDVKSRNSDGIDVQRLSSGDINQVSNVNINITTNGGEIKVLENPTFEGSSNFGVVARLYDAAAGNITLTNNGTKISTGLGLDGLAPSSSALDAAFANTTATGNISIFNSGELSTKGVNANTISAVNAGSGKITITNVGAISTQGTNSHGINAIDSGTGDINVTNSGAISISGARSSGIYAEMSVNAISSGKITIKNSGNIISNTGDPLVSNQGHAIYALINNAGVESGGIDITQNGGNITTTGFNATGIEAVTTAKTGDINVTVNNAIINANGGKGDGINVRSGGPLTNINQISNVNLNVTTNGGEINVLDGVSGSGDTSNGIMAYQFAAASGDINIINNGTKITTGLGVDGLGASAAAMDVRFMGTTATGNINISNFGDLSTAGAGEETSAIYAGNLGTGKTNVLNTGMITTTGNLAHGIKATASNGEIVVGNTGEINVGGVEAAGIHAVATATNDQNITIYNTGNITTQNVGIFARAGAGDALILSSGNILSSQDATGRGGAHGLEALSLSGFASIQFDDGKVTTVGRGDGIRSWDNNTGTGTGAEVILGSNAVVDASKGLAGISVVNSHKGLVSIASGAVVHGGDKNNSLTGAPITYSVAGIRFSGEGTPDFTLNNAGYIDSMNDVAISNISSTGSSIGGTLTVNNTGTITGYLTLNDEDTTFSNFSSNSWNIRNFADTDGDQIRDTKAIAISDFGLGNDTFKNETTGTIRLAAVTGETTVDASNEYITAGALSINNAGTVQGQLLNLNTFENRGTIDLTENKQAGDILLISGGATAGTYGGGQFVSDGGSLKLDTVLNDGGVNSLSDMLVIDDSTTASGATKLYISQTGNGDLTQGEGIKVIETLGSSSSNSFALGKPVAAGLYEYILNQGSSDQNWYLSSRYNQNLPIFNPATGAYLANQSAASSLFMHTLYDRQGHANNVAGGSAEKPSVWVRAATSKSRNQSVNGMMGTKTDASLIHLGGDVAKWQNENGNLHLGLMGSYGQTDSDVTSQVTHTTAKGKVTGFALGVYGTWFADEAQGKGLYVDGWAQYGWYKNKVSGAAQVNNEEKYDSTNWTTSVEAGYGIHLHREDNTDLMLTPQVQVTYNHYSADDHKDGNNLKVSGSDASGVITRLGARMYGKAVEGYGARPYMEANWVHNTAKNELDFNGEVLKDQIPKDKGELKLGLQGTVSKNLKVWGQVGGQWGGENYERYEGQVGVNYQW